MFKGMSQRPSRPFWSRAYAAALVLAIAPFVVPGAAEAKTPGKTYCFNGTCHQVKSIAEMVALVGRQETMTSSFYDDCKRDRYNPCGLTSSGEVYRPNDADNAASPIYPDGTVLLLRNPKNGESAVVRVNNAGPYWGKNRKLDVSRGTAQALGFKKRGLAKLEVKVLSAPTAAEARYKKNRRYDAVPGALGTYASLAAAEGRAMIALAEGKTPVGASRGIRLAAADILTTDVPVGAGDTEETPADGLRAAARRALGLSPDVRRIAPSTLTAEALYAIITTVR